MTRCGLESTGGGKYRQAASHKLLLISNIPNTVGPRRGVEQSPNSLGQVVKYSDALLLMNVAAKNIIII